MATASVWSAAPTDWRLAMSRFKKCLFVLTTSLLVLAGIQYPVSAASYNLQQASKWAAAHAQDDQPNFNGCASKTNLPSFTEQECNHSLNTERCSLVKTSTGQPYMELRGNSSNSTDDIRAIFLQKNTTLIRVQPVNDTVVFTTEDWNVIATTLLNTLEPRSFEGSPYHFFDRWNI